MMKFKRLHEKIIPYLYYGFGTGLFLTLMQELIFNTHKLMFGITMLSACAIVIIVAFSRGLDERYETIYRKYMCFYIYEPVQITKIKKVKGKNIFYIEGCLCGKSHWTDYNCKEGVQNGKKIQT